MAQTDWTYLNDGLDVATVDRGATAGIPRPPGGGAFLFGFNSLTAAKGAVALFANQPNFAPMAKGGSIRACLQRGPGGGPTGFSPFLFLCGQGTSVNDNAYQLGLSDDDPDRIVLRKGSVVAGLPTSTGSPSASTSRSRIRSSEPDVVVAADHLAFAGVAPPILRIYPVETHVAEKLHAYTMPRARPNSRVKDLPDLALLATVRELDASRLRAALEQTFSFRKTHPLPTSVPTPPATWTEVYAAMAIADDLQWRTLDELLAAVSAFLEPALAGPEDARWSPSSWSWRGP